VPQVHRTMWAVLGLAGRWRIVMHQSGLHQRVSNMVRHYREQSDGLEVAPAILLGLYCAVAGCFGVWSVRPSSAYTPFKSQPVRVPISTRNDCDLCAIAPIERCTAADPRRRNRKRPAQRRSGGTTSKNPIARLSRNVPDASAKPLSARSSAARRWTMPHNRSSGAPDYGSSEIRICLLLRGTNRKCHEDQSGPQTESWSAMAPALLGGPGK
jgi:hypothetical protein